MEENKKNKSSQQVINEYLNGGDGSLNEEHRTMLFLENVKNRKRTSTGILEALEAAGIKVTTVKTITSDTPEPPEVKPAEQDKSKLEISRMNAIAETKASALKYAAIEAANALLGAASEGDQKQRKAICGGCVHRAISYKGRTDPAGFGWCTKCGCGSNTRALLENKIKMPMTECPLNLWGKVEGTGATAQTVWDTVKGVGQSVKHLLTGNSDTEKPTL